MARVATALPLLAVFAMLAACEDGTLNRNEFATYDDLSGEYERIAAEHAGTALSDPALLPTTGVAVYEGVINIIVEAGGGVPADLLSAVGGLELEADFDVATGGIAGGAGNFWVDDGTPSGSLIDGGGRFRAGFINRSVDPALGETFILTMLPGFTLGDYTLDGSLSGDFRDQTGAGTVPDGAAGIVGGTVTNEPGATFRGTFVTQFDPEEGLGEE